jgi:hypothetical protein
LADFIFKNLKADTNLCINDQNIEECIKVGNISGNVFILLIEQIKYTGIARERDTIIK